MTDSTLRRRLVTVPAVVVSWALVVALLPIGLVVALVVDLIRRLRSGTPAMAIRLVVFLTVYLSAEVAGVAALTVVAAFDRRRPVPTATFAIQRTWARLLLATVRVVFDMRIAADGVEAVARPPYLLLVRHTSIVDNLLPAHLISRVHGTHIRYVMKDELLMDPCIDIAGNRLPNHFVRRGAGNTDEERRALRSLIETMGGDEAVLIYPEGTRYTETKRLAAVKRLSRGPLADRAAALRRVLPPKPAGVLALLDAADIDVVLMGHHGLDGFAHVADIWRGSMVGTTVQVWFERVRRAAIPSGTADRTTWLYETWQRLDDEVVARSGFPGLGGSP